MANVKFRVDHGLADGYIANPRTIIAISFPSLFVLRLFDTLFLCYTDVVRLGLHFLPVRRLPIASWLFSTQPGPVLQSYRGSLKEWNMDDMLTHPGETW